MKLVISLSPIDPALIYVIIGDSIVEDRTTFNCGLVQTIEQIQKEYNNSLEEIAIRGSDIYTKQIAEELKETFSFPIYRL